MEVNDIEMDLDYEDDLGYEADYESDSESKEKPTPVHLYPQASEVLAMAEDGSDQKLTSMAIIDELVYTAKDYPKTVVKMMKRGILKKSQNCRRCKKPMILRIKKNYYEWRCRNKKGDCSSCSIRAGSWFANTKLPLKLALEFLVMFCKRSSFAHMQFFLQQQTHLISNSWKGAFEIMDRFLQKYSILGVNGETVLIETIHVKPRNNTAPSFNVVAGREVGTKRCFAVVMADQKGSTFEKITKSCVHRNGKMKMITTLPVGEAGSTCSSVEFFDESQHYPNSWDQFFNNIRTKAPDFVFDDNYIQHWLNEEVVRKTDGKMVLENFFDELIKYVD